MAPPAQFVEQGDDRDPAVAREGQDLAAESLRGPPGGRPGPGRSRRPARGTRRAVRASRLSVGSRAARVEHDPERRRGGRRAGRSARGRRPGPCRCRRGSRPSGPGARGPGPATSGRRSSGCRRWRRRSCRRASWPTWRDVGAAGGQPLEVGGVEPSGVGLLHARPRRPGRRRGAASKPPPATRGNGSRIAATTRAIPAARTAVGAGGRLAVVAAGFEGDVQRRSPGRVAGVRPGRRPRRAGRRSGRGGRRRPIRPSRTTTAPTSGFGSTAPRPRSASARARRIQNSSSGTPLILKKSSERSVDRRRRRQPFLRRSWSRNRASDRGPPRGAAAVEAGRSAQSRPGRIDQSVEDGQLSPRFLGRGRIERAADPVRHRLEEQEQVFERDHRRQVVDEVIVRGQTVPRAVRVSPGPPFSSSRTASARNLTAFSNEASSSACDGLRIGLSFCSRAIPSSLASRWGSGAFWICSFCFGLRLSQNLTRVGQMERERRRRGRRDLIGRVERPRSRVAGPEPRNHLHPLARRGRLQLGPLRLRQALDPEMIRPQHRVVIRPVLVGLGRELLMRVPGWPPAPRGQAVDSSSRSAAGTRHSRGMARSRSRFASTDPEPKPGTGSGSEPGPGSDRIPSTTKVKVTRRREIHGINTPQYGKKRGFIFAVHEFRRVRQLLQKVEIAHVAKYSSRCSAIDRSRARRSLGFGPDGVRRARSRAGRRRPTPRPRFRRERTAARSGRTPSRSGPPRCRAGVPRSGSARRNHRGPTDGADARAAPRSAPAARSRDARLGCGSTWLRCPRLVLGQLAVQVRDEIRSLHGRQSLLFRTGREGHSQFPLRPMPGKPDGCGP